MHTLGFEGWKGLEGWALPEGGLAWDACGRRAVMRRETGDPCWGHLPLFCFPPAPHLRWRSLGKSPFDVNPLLA